MEIHIDDHTLERAEERGTNEGEIRDTLETGKPMPAKQGRRGKFKVYDFNQTWRSRFYKGKRVEGIYPVEDDTIVTVTVYVFYGEWKDKE